MAELAGLPDNILSDEALPAVLTWIEVLAGAMGSRLTISKSAGMIPHCGVVGQGGAE